MNCLKVKDVLDLLEKYKKRYGDKILDAPIVIGDDEELNGVHLAFYCEEYNTNKRPKDTLEQRMLEDLKEQTSWYDFKQNKKIEYKGLTILIS